MRPFNDRPPGESQAFFGRETINSPFEAEKFNWMLKCVLCAGLSAGFRKGIPGEERVRRIVLTCRGRISATRLCLCFAVAVEMLQRGEQKLFYFVPVVEGYLADGRVVHDAEVPLYFFPAVLK